MEDFKKLFVVKNGGSSGWTDSDRSTFVVSVECNILQVYCKSGRDMFPHEVNTAIGRFRKAYEEEFGEKVALCLLH